MFSIILMALAAVFVQARGGGGFSQPEPKNL